MSIIPTNVNYNYSLMKQNLRTLENAYPFIHIQFVGKSVLQKNLYVVRLRNWFKRSFLFWFYSCKWVDYKPFTYEIYWKLLYSL